MILAEMFVTGTLFLTSCIVTANDVWHYMRNLFLLANCAVL